MVGKRENRLLVLWAGKAIHRNQWVWTCLFTAKRIWDGKRQANYEKSANAFFQAQLALWKKKQAKKNNLLQDGVGERHYGGACKKAG